MANIVQSLKLPDGNIKVLVEGIERAKVLQIIDTEGFIQQPSALARYTVETNTQLEAAMQRVTTLFEQYVKLCQSLNYETMIAAVRMEDPAKLTETVPPTCNSQSKKNKSCWKYLIPPNDLRALPTFLISKSKN